jgi:hypothetical protein
MFILFLFGKWPTGTGKSKFRCYKIALSTTKKAQEHQKDGYDLKTRGGIVEVGDTVLVKIVAWDGKHKLSDHWEDKPYVILKPPNVDIPFI